jgi:predicted Zn-dependent protease
MEGDLDGAIRQQQQVLQQAPGNISAVRDLSLAYMQAGKIEKARMLLEEKRAVFSKNYMWRSVWALLLVLEGKHADALKAMDEETLKFLGGGPITPVGAAEVYAMAGEKSKAVEWLEKTVRNGDERAEWFRKDPWLASVRDDPRFRGILESIERARKQRAAQ